ncbi:ribonuclease H-like domain-containing protein [Mycena galericulata]|nr:ribonuclease H-like domain-containing protein [Mycena galericulata]
MSTSPTPDLGRSTLVVSARPGAGPVAGGFTRVLRLNAGQDGPIEKLKVIRLIECIKNVKRFDLMEEAQEGVFKSIVPVELVVQKLSNVSKVDQEVIEITSMERPLFALNSTLHYLDTRRSVNRALHGITDGVVGFDTEFVARKLTPEDDFIDSVLAKVGGGRRSVVAVLQAKELQRSRFGVAWNNIGLCVVQLARGDDVWVINLTKIKAYPAELRRILESPSIIKTGVGLLNDVQVVWTDLGSDMRNLVDVGLMARLLLAEKYPDTGYSNLSMAVSVQEVLGMDIDKDPRKSDWKGGDDNVLTGDQIRYAAIDAVASLRLYEALVPALDEKSVRLNLDIPQGWYTFNSAYGEPTRTQLTHQGQVALWSTRETCTWFFGGKFQGYY